MSVMWEYRVVGANTRPAWWHTVLFGLFTLFWSLSSWTFSPLTVRQQATANGSDAAQLMLALLLILGLTVGLWWRHRYPFTLVVVASAGPLLLPIGNSLSLVSLATLLGRRAGPRAWLATALVAATSTWVAVADWLAQPRAASFMKYTLGSSLDDPNQPSQLGIEVLVAVTVIGLGTSIGAGLLVRSRREASLARQEAHEGREESSRLGDEVARRQERERIAREVHDAMGHRLSLLNLHAGALEANASGDPRLAESAHLVRESARAALDDLRSLLDVLREPLGADPPDIPLARLSDVVRDAFGAGQPLNSSIFIADADSAAPALSRAVYRTVQELLTNARKHAPGQPVLLQVNGSPDEGVTIDCRNPCPPGGPPVSSTSSRGLKGVAERAELLDGQVRYGLDENGTMFRVTVHLPWRHA